MTDAGENVEKREPFWLVGMQIDGATMENSMEIPQNGKNGTALWPSITTFGNISKETWNTNLKEYITPIYNRQAMKATQVPINRRVD